MGEVWRAWDTKLNRWVALKFLKGGNDEEIARFQREAQAAGKLTHSNITAIYEVGEDQGKHYIAMQYVDGQTLRSFPRENQRTLAQLVRDAALGVQFAHEQGIIHRDIKPDNIMVTTRAKSGGTGRFEPGKITNEHHVYVMDFGLARMTEGVSELSVSGMIMGTPAYMSPEQARGERVDGRADVYSLGASLYELLTHCKPFDGANVYAILKKVQDNEPTGPRKLNPRIDKDLETITLKCLEKNRDRRYADAAELADDLSRWLNGEAIKAHPPSARYILQKYIARHKAVLIPSAAAALLAIGIGVWAGTQRVETGNRIKRGMSDAALLEKDGRIAEARDHYKSVLQLDKKNAEAAAGLARIEAELTRRAREREDRAKAEQEAAKLFEMGRPALDKAYAYLYNKDAAYDELVKRVDLGQKIIEDAVNKAPHLPLGHYLLGRAWALTGWDDKAEACWRQALSLDKNFGPAHYQLGRLLLTRAFIAHLASDEADREAKWADVAHLAKEAATEIETALKEGSGLDDAVQREIARAFFAFAKQDFPSMRTIAQQALTNAADGKEDLHWLIGVASKEEQRLPEYEQALAVCPKHALALFCRADYFRAKGDLEKAITGYGEALKINPRMVDAYINRASLRGRIGDYDGTIADCTDALKITSRLADAYIARGGAYERKGMWDEAIADCTAALTIEPKNPKAYHNRASARYGKGDLDSALEDYTHALNINPKYANAHFGRAIVHHRKGDLTVAVADYQKALDVAPKDWPHRETVEKTLRALREQ
jgi:tetratricopeptide (TPR) repeat protein